MLPSRGFLLHCIAAFNIIGTVSGQANVYNTSTDSFRITCNPAPGKCNGSYDYTRGTATVSDPIVGGTFRFDTTSAYFHAGGCIYSNCSIYCDDNCGCETGTSTDRGSFFPDGGLCSIISTTSDDVPTDPPTAAPTASPTFDVVEAVQYDFTEVTDPDVMLIRDCMSGDSLKIGSFDSYCEVQSGFFLRSTFSSTYLKCSDVDTCIVACSKNCTCEIITGNGITKNCTIMKPTQSPSQVPTANPTVLDSSSRSATFVTASLWIVASLAVLWW